MAVETNNAESRPPSRLLSQFGTVAAEIDRDAQAGPARRDEVLNAALLSFVNLTGVERRQWVLRLRKMIPIWVNEKTGALTEGALTEEEYHKMAAQIEGRADLPAGRVGGPVGTT